jgi:conjugative transfer pilus assembly protein TraH
MTKTILNIFTLFSYVFVSNFAYADALSDAMNTSFDQMMSSTPAGSYNSQTRGVITGGSLYQRSKITSYGPLVNFQPPSFKSGCGGTDAFLGSFGFVNHIDFEGILKGIAMNARGYAFQLAMDIACPTCAANMKILQDKMQSMQAKMSNSCELAKAGINKFTRLEDMADLMKSDARTKATKTGKFDSWWNSTTDDKASSGGGSSTAATRNTDAEDIEANLVGNVIWKALSKQNVATWYGALGADAQQLHQIAMSFSGTIISRKKDVEVVSSPTELGPPVTAPLGPEKDYSIEYTKGPLTLGNLIHGKLASKVLKCLPNPPDLPGDEWLPDKCLVLGEDTLDIKGYAPKINELLNGVSGGSKGIIKKLRDKNSAYTFTTDERAFIEGASPGILGILSGFSADIRSAQTVGEMFAIVIAQELAIKFVNEMMDNMFVAVGKFKNTAGLKDKALEMIKERKEEFAYYRNIEGHTFQGLNNAFVAAQNVRSSLGSVMSANRDTLNGK